jgi:hypothetical protein
MTRPAKIGLLLAACACACAASAARADWIVTRDGGKLEIKGSWQLKGKLVVFSLPNGTLSSLRSDQVDLAASQRATEQAKKEAAEAAASGADKQRDPAARPKKASVRVLTDKDFKKAPPEPVPTEPAAKGGKEKEKDKEAAKETVPAPPGSLQVVTWDRVKASNLAAVPGVQLTGKVRNSGSDLLTEMVVTATFFDETGASIARVPAVIDVLRLAPGEIGSFTVDAPSVSGFAAVKFDAQGKGFKLRSQPAPKDAAAAPPGGEAPKPASPPPG